jgi:hypothetical protein
VDNKVITIVPQAGLSHSKLYYIALKPVVEDDLNHAVGNVVSTTFTTEAATSSGGGGGGGGGGGAASNQDSDPLTPVTEAQSLTEKYPGINTVITEDDSKLNLALKTTDEPRIDLARDTDAKAILSLTTVKEIEEAKKYLLLQNQTLNVKIDLTTLGLEKISGSAQDTLEFQVKALTEADKTILLQRMTAAGTSGIYNIGENVFDLAAKINIVEEGSNTKSIESFAEPVAVIADLSKLSLTQEQISKLCGIRLKINEKGEILPVKLGGNYDAASKTFTFYTDGFGYCTVMGSQTLTKVNLFINNNVTKLNDKYKLTDVPPTIVNNRTMVPLRYIGEALGAQFKWDEKNHTVTFTLANKEVKMVINQGGPGLDSPPTLIKGRTMVPVRYISEAFGAQVMWFPSAQSVMVIK